MHRYRSVLRFHLYYFSELCLVELAIDTGKIITDAGDAPIMELELELFAGDRDSIRRLGDRMCERYGLSPLDSSKFARGLALLSA